MTFFRSHPLSPHMPMNGEKKKEKINKYSVFYLFFLNNFNKKNFSQKRGEVCVPPGGKNRDSQDFFRISSNWFLVQLHFLCYLYVRHCVMCVCVERELAAN